MEVNKIYNESCLATLSKMQDKSIDCVITSPPYWQLRDYGYDGQWGLEPTYHKYLEHLWSLMNEIYRVLKDEGTAWINLGDTYGTQSGNMRNPVPSKESDYAGNAIAISQPKSIHKCLLLIPHRFAIGCIDRGWIMRNDCIWAKRNGMPESVTDRFSKKHEYFFFMVKSEKYFFDLDAIREKQKESSISRYAYDFTGQEGGSSDNFKGQRLRDKSKENYSNGLLTPIGKGARPEWNIKGKNPGSISDFWDIPTKPSSEKHYASYNDVLLKKPILAGCPENGVVYDPFMGTGSTAEVCLRSNRSFIGSEMSKEYCDIADKRLAPFLTQNKLF